MRVRLPAIETERRRKAARVVEVGTAEAAAALVAQGGELLEDLHPETKRALAGAPVEPPVAVVPPHPEEQPSDGPASPAAPTTEPASGSPAQPARAAGKSRGAK